MVSHKRRVWGYWKLCTYGASHYMNQTPMLVTADFTLQSSGPRRSSIRVSWELWRMWPSAQTGRDAHLHWGGLQRRTRGVDGSWVPVCTTLSFFLFLLHFASSKHRCWSVLHGLPNRSYSIHYFSHIDDRLLSDTRHVSWHQATRLFSWGNTRYCRAFLSLLVCIA